jgi:hypothetical protein
VNREERQTRPEIWIEPNGGFDLASSGNDADPLALREIQLLRVRGREVQSLSVANGRGVSSRLTGVERPRRAGVRRI